MRRVMRRTVVFGLLVCLCWSPGAAYAEKTDARQEISLHYYRGVVNFEARRYDNALSEFQAVAAIDPYYKDTQQYIEACVRNLEQAREELFRGQREGETREKEAFDLYFVGKSYYEKGDHKRALDAFKAALDKNPNDKFAQYYIQLCQRALPPGKRSSYEKGVSEVGSLEKEVTYLKSDLEEQEDMESFLESKALRRSERDELIRKKEKQLKEQEELLAEEREDYLAQAKISKQAERIKRQAEKWKAMKESLASKQPGVPAELTEYPVYLHKADNYYAAMKEALRKSRWNAAGLNAIQASINYCDAVLIYFYGVKSASPAHENIARLLAANVKRADIDENLFHLRAVLNLKKVVEDEDRPINRSEALFLADHAEKLTEWCASVLPR